MKKSVVALTVVALSALAAVPAQADVRAGLLTCQVAPGVGYVVFSQKDVRCEFKSVSGRSERYAGHVSRIGVDLGFTSAEQLAWAVYAPSRAGRGALAGVYAGVSGAATIGVGVGANVLVGGFKDSVSLQPVSVGAQQGLDVAGGAMSLELVPVRR